MSDDSGDCRDWWNTSTVMSNPPVRHEVIFPTPTLPYKNNNNAAPATSYKPRAFFSSNPTAASAATTRPIQYWGIALDAHQPFFASLLDIVPEASRFFSRFPQALRKDEFHVTLRFVGGARLSPEEHGAYRSIEGSSVRVQPRVLLVTSKLIALSVTLPDAHVAGLCRNACPHVTMALAPMVKAYQSNEELERMVSGELFQQDGCAAAVPIGDGMELVGMVKRYY